MNWRGETSKVSDDLLRCEIWRYWLREGSTFEFDSHSILVRPTRRHKFTVEKCWSRLNSRSNTMERQEPEQWVKDEIRDKFVASIKFI